MKKYLFLAALFCMGSVCMTSCGDDDDEKLPKIDEDTEFVTSKPTLKKVEGKQLTLSYTESVGKVKISVVEDWFFENSICVKATVTETYPSESMAKTVFEDMKKEGEDEGYTRNGKSIIFDASSSYARMTYQNIEEMLEWRVKEWEHMQK